MAKRLCFFLVCLLIMATCCFASAEDAASIDYPTLAWNEHTLSLQAIFINPEHIVGNPAPDQNKYLLCRFACMGGSVPIFDLIDGMESFWMEDAEGNEYPVSAYMPYSIVFNERNRVFATAPDQSMFDLFFILPSDVELSTLTLYANEASLSLTEAFDAGIIQEQAQ